MRATPAKRPARQPASWARALLCAACTTPGALAPGTQAGLERIARLEHEPLKEVSGITRSSYPGIFWVHNDRGDEARLFAIRLDGSPVVPLPLAERYAEKTWPGLELLNAWNVDWEDVASDGTHLFVADTGNNGNARRDLGVYVLAEPNPLATERTRALRFLPIRYPDQEAFPAAEWHFDCEAVFLADGRLHFLTKHRRAGQPQGWTPGTKLYRLDTASTDEENVLTLVGTRADVGVPTGADMSPDGQRLAVLTHRTVWVFDRPASGDDWLRGTASRFDLAGSRAEGSEGITWTDDGDLLIASEDRELFRLDSAALARAE